jgi:hypothetical protein
VVYDGNKGNGWKTETYRVIINNWNYSDNRKLTALPVWDVDGLGV